MESDGAKMPPGAPDQAVSQVATNLSGMNSCEVSLPPASMSRTASEPLP